MLNSIETNPTYFYNFSTQRDDGDIGDNNSQDIFWDENIYVYKSDESTFYSNQ